MFNFEEKISNEWKVLSRTIPQHIPSAAHSTVSVFRAIWRFQGLSSFFGRGFWGWNFLGFVAWDFLEPRHATGRSIENLKKKKQELQKKSMTHDAVKWYEFRYMANPPNSLRHWRLGAKSESHPWCRGNRVPQLRYTLWQFRYVFVLVILHWRVLLKERVQYGNVKKRHTRYTPTF